MTDFLIGRATSNLELYDSTLSPILFIFNQQSMSQGRYDAFSSFVAAALNDIIQIRIHVLLLMYSTDSKSNGIIKMSIHVARSCSLL